MRRLGVIAALVAGCYSPHVACEVECGFDSPCPADLSCGSDQYCHASDDDQTCTTTLSVMMTGNADGHVTSSPDGVDCHSNDPDNGCRDIPFRIGTAITLSAMRTGSGSFMGWSGDACSGIDAPTCELTIESSITVNARFN